MVATPTYDGTLHHRFVKAYEAALLYCVVRKVELELRIVAGSSLIQYARNQLLREFLDETDFTHIMWIDADVGFDPRGIIKLLEHGLDVVGGVYPMKVMPIEWPYEPMPGEQKAGLHRAKTMPGGFLLCTRRAMQACADQAPKYWHHMAGVRYRTSHVFDLVLDEESETLLGEDVILCQRVRKAGFDVWVDPDMHFSHCGSFEWRGNLAVAIEQRQVHTPLNAATLGRLQHETQPDAIAGIVTELYHAWANTFSPPVAELVALVYCARKATRILEMGCGLSTVIMAAANPKATIECLEQDMEWATRVRDECRSNGLEGVTIHVAPLSRETDWFYVVPEDLLAQPAFDLAFVDGPTFLNGTHLAKPADTRLPFYRVFEAQTRNAVLVIDDVEQYGQVLPNYSSQVVGDRFAICTPKVAKSEAA